MTDNEKIIECIDRYLAKLSVKRLRMILQLIYQFERFPEKEEATN